MEQINWRWHHFDTMSTAAWHDILMLRADVFIVEQACPYKDPDLKDRVSWHLPGRMSNDLVATMRVVPPGVSYDECSIGRVVVPTSLRGQRRGVEWAGPEQGGPAAKAPFLRFCVILDARRNSRNFEYLRQCFFSV